MRRPYPLKRRSLSAGPERRLGVIIEIELLPSHFVVQGGWTNTIDPNFGRKLLRYMKIEAKAA